jgi:two-component system OmpR family response regulator
MQNFISSEGDFHQSHSGLIFLGEITIESENRLISNSQESYSLGHREIQILCLLAERPGKIISREYIIDSLYKEDGPFDRTIDSHVSHLRNKLRKLAGDSVKIKAVYGKGYLLECHKIQK